MRIEIENKWLDGQMGGKLPGRMGGQGSDRKRRNERRRRKEKKRTEES